MSWWEKNWLAVIIVALLLVTIQTEWFDLFNYTIRALINLLVFGFYGTGVLFALVIVILLSYFFSSQKKPAAH